MNGGQLLIVTLLGLLALTEGGHLFGKGLVKGAFKSLFKSSRKEPQHCEIKWEDVWKPHCTTTYEKICKQEPQKECSTEWREECWTEHEEKCETEWSSECKTEYHQQCRTEWVEECWEEDEEICEWLQDCHEEPKHHYSPEPEEHHYSPKTSSHGQHESTEPTVQAGTTKRSADDHHEHDDEDSLDDIDEKALTEVLENIPASELLKLSQEIESQENPETGVATLGDDSSRKKRSIHLLNLHLLGKHLLGKGLLQKALGTKVGAKVAPKELCKKYPEEKCWETFHESCWDEPREHCTEKKIKVAKKWCVEHEKEEENAFDKIKNLF